MFTKLKYGTYLIPRDLIIGQFEFDGPPPTIPDSEDEEFVVLYGYESNSYVKLRFDPEIDYESFRLDNFPSDAREFTYDTQVLDFQKFDSEVFQTHVLIFALNH